MRQVNEYLVYDGDVMHFHFPAKFVGVDESPFPTDKFKERIYVSVLEDKDEHLMPPMKMHVVLKGAETEARAEWLVGYDRGITVFAERLK